MPLLVQQHDTALHKLLPSYFTDSSLNVYEHEHDTVLHKPLPFRGINVHYVHRSIDADGGRRGRSVSPARLR